MRILRSRSDDSVVGWRHAFVESVRVRLGHQWVGLAWDLGEVLLGGVLDQFSLGGEHHALVVLRVVVRVGFAAGHRAMARVRGDRSRVHGLFVVGDLRVVAMVGLGLILWLSTV